jgi:hypothetical protein
MSVLVAIGKSGGDAQKIQVMSGKPPLVAAYAGMDVRIVLEEQYQKLIH